LVEIVVDVMLSLPFFIYYTYASYIPNKDAYDSALYKLIAAITSTISYATFAVSAVL
jgi:hypothetical protein